MDIWELDATGQAELIRQREIHPLELLEITIRRIDALNPSLNAVISRMDDKAQQAAQAEINPDAPFYGVPLLLKDYLCEIADTPYFCGSKLLRDINWHSSHDSYLAARFRKAGFNFLGKTNLPEFAGGAITENEVFGITRNPWNLDHSPDGSSGGSAAAVASGMVAVAHGNDGLGSIRGPASACGLVGLKPSRGRMPTGPQWHAGFFGNVMEFVLTKSVRDTAAILDAVHGAAPGNIFNAPPPRRSFLEELTAPFQKYRFGLMKHDTILNLSVHPDCEQAVEKAGTLLQGLGHHVEYAFPPQLDSGATGLGLALRIVSTTGLKASLDRWSEKIGHQAVEQDVEPATWEAAQLGQGFTGVQVQQAYQRLAEGACRVVEWWESGFDFLITPVRTQPPPKTGLTDPDQRAAAFGFFTMPYSLSGQPAVAIPMHITEDGLPIGIQIVADYGREDLLIQVATQLEQVNPWADKLPYTWTV